MAVSSRHIQVTLFFLGCVVLYYNYSFNFRKTSTDLSPNDIIPDSDSYSYYENGTSTEVDNFCVCNTDDMVVLDFIHMYSTSCPITINAAGRLGNLMGQYASLFGLARMNGRTAYMPENMNTRLKRYFDLSMPVMERGIAARINWKTTWVNDQMVKEYTTFKCDFTKITGYPCSWTFFNDFKRRIKREFTFKPNIIKTCQKQLRKYRRNKKSATFIGIHVRRGEYVFLMKNFYDGVLADADYFENAMGYFRDKYPDSLFVVCSDDLDWSKKNINSSRGDVFFCWNGTRSTPGRDMALLVQCNHTIMTVGTFSFWSAYLAGGEVIYLNNYTRPGSRYQNIFQTITTYLPEWLEINANLTSTGWY